MTHPQDYLSKALYEFSVGNTAPAIKLAKKACLYYNQVLKSLQGSGPPSTLSGYCASHALSPAESISSATQLLDQALAVYDGLKAGTKVLDSQTQLIYLSSNCNHNFFYPWLDPLEIGGSSGSSGSSEGKDEDCALSDLQLETGCDWQLVASSDLHACDSPDFYCQSPRLEDCSIVSSLISLRNLELRRGLQHRFVDQCLVWLPESGTYAVKLNHNGTLRKVSISALLPVSTTDSETLLTVTCTCESPNTCQNSLTAALIEKAYVKLMGGYRFPGSHSAIDTYVLSGWIPEYVPIHHYFEEDSTSREKLWDTLYNAWNKGSLLICLGTPVFSKADTESLRLASSHDYTVLDMRIDTTTQMRQLKIRNPWSKQSCIAKNLLYCEWIDFDLVCSRFYCFYLNWDPASFNACQKTHFLYSGTDTTGATSMGKTPQFVVENTHSEPAVFNILNMAHFKKSFANTKTFFSLSLYDSGEIVRLPNEYKSLAHSPLRNTSYSMLRVTLPPKSESVVVIYHDGDPLDAPSETGHGSDDDHDQATNNKIIPMTLSVYSDLAQDYVKVRRAKSSLPFSANASDAWTSYQCGGNWSLKSYETNPQYKLHLDQDASALKVYLVSTMSNSSSAKAKEDPCNGKVDPSPIAINVTIFGPESGQFDIRNMICGSGTYRVGRCMATVSNSTIRKGVYTVIPSTYDIDARGSFSLEAWCDAPISLTKSIPATMSQFSRSVLLAWSSSNTLYVKFSVPRACLVQTEVNILDRSSSTPSLFEDHEQLTQYRPYIRVSIIDSQSGTTVGTSGQFEDPVRPISCSANVLGNNRVYWCVIERMESGYGGVQAEFHSEVPISLEN